MRGRLLGIAMCGSCLGTHQPDGLFDDACTAVAVDAGSRGFATLPMTWTRDEGLGAWVSAPVRVNVPDDVRGVSVTLDAGAARTAVLSATLDGRVVLDARQGLVLAARRSGRVTADSWFDTFFDTADTGVPEGFPGWNAAPFFHLPTVAATLQLPMNARSRPWGGCLDVTGVAVDDPGDAGTLRVAVQRRADDVGVLDLDVVVLEGADLTEDQLAQVLGVVDTVYASHDGPGLGTVQWFTMQGVDPRPRLRDLPGLRAVPIAGHTDGATLILVAAGFTGSPGTLGLAGGLPGPLGATTPASGVALNLGAHRDADYRLDVRLLGETLAHELGHQLGLFHTTEANGRSFDVHDDTPTCDVDLFDDDRDGTVSAEECVSRDGRNLMFWTAGDFAQDALSPGQVDVLVRSPATRRSP
ncbi:MAG: hypothetical protein H6733_13135 [Alphaproteobacteria bacterium]|nr:hypothetical protein [Alphaproteobacteria bacterium]